MSLKTFILYSFLFVFLFVSCEPERKSIRKYRNGNYEWLLDFFIKEDLTCDKANGKVLLNKKFGELEVDEKHASQSHKGKYELKLKAMSKLLDKDGYFHFYIKEFRDSSFLLEYSSEHRYPSATDEKLVEIHQDKGTIRCRCDEIIE